MALQAMLMFVTVTQGNVSLIDEPRTVVIRSAEEWRTLWKAHSPQTVLDVDFNGAVVVGVFLGSRPTSGYRVQIEAIRQRGTTMVVEYRERRPDPADVVAQILTAPFHVVRVASRPEMVEFTRLQ